MARNDKIARLLHQLGQGILQLLIFIVLCILLTALTVALYIALRRFLEPNDFWDAAFAVGIFLLWLPGFWYAIGWSNTLARRIAGSAKPRFWVKITENEIVSCGIGKPTETVLWRDLTAVAIENVDNWPIGHQYWLLFSSNGSGAVVPAEAEGAAELLEAMQKRLPGFDDRAVIEAMGSLDGWFEVWKKPG